MEAFLIFEDGEVFPGRWIGSPKESPGEVVFTTGMTGYQEVMTDPSYSGQIVTFTYPLIGNYGKVPGESESKFPSCAGIVVNEWCKDSDHLGKWLDAWNIPAIAGVDTRAVVRKVRETGPIRGVISTHPRIQLEKWPDPLSLQWVNRVSVQKPVSYPSLGPNPFHVVLIDFGVKTSIINTLLQRGCRGHSRSMVYGAG